MIPFTLAFLVGFATGYLGVRIYFRRRRTRRALTVRGVDVPTTDAEARDPLAYERLRAERFL